MYVKNLSIFSQNVQNHFLLGFLRYLQSSWSTVLNDSNLDGSISLPRDASVKRETEPNVVGLELDPHGLRVTEEVVATTPSRGQGHWGVGVWVREKISCIHSYGYPVMS